MGVARMTKNSPVGFPCQISQPNIQAMGKKYAYLGWMIKIKIMTDEQLIKKAKLWLVLHGWENFGRFKELTCQSVKCKYLNKASGCPILVPHRRWFKELDGVCLSWLDDAD